MTALLTRLKTAWCHLMHPAPMWPAHGWYECRVCPCKHPVPWEHKRPMEAR